jgi:hypothetical protein
MSLVFLIAAACSSSGSDPGSRPAGVELCYAATEDTTPETEAYWRAMLSADYAARPAALSSLATAAQGSPKDEQLALLTGLGNLWRVAEPTDAELADVGGFIQSALTAKAEVERAYQLCPSDHRIPAWLGPILVNMGRQLNDQASVEMGLSVLQTGIERYPSFVLFSKLLVYADRPASDPDFQKALQAVDENIGACGDLATTRDPACRNGPHTVHNVEGAAVFLGDVYAKAGRRADALRVYEDARRMPDFGTWPFRGVLEARISGIDERLAAYAAGGEPEAAWTSRQQCSYCHQR